MNDVAIKVDGLSKAYQLGARAARSETLAQAVFNAAIAPIRNFRRLRSLDTFSGDGSSDDLLWALNDVSFEIQRGEVVGFVGRNGAGKSTLLKILSRIAEPTRGRVEIRGRVSSLLEVGTGFHPELTGRENVYMNGTILGMKKVEIDAKFDEIVGFSGVERFLDTPVKRYSSGMKVRLAFAVAAHLEPEILIVDEVLAVGDAEFQQRCLGKMQDVAGSGRTVLFVSHNMGAVQDLCQRALVLRNGRTCDDGEPRSVIAAYLASMSTGAQSAFAEDNPERSGSGDVRFTKAVVQNQSSQISEILMSGEDIELCFTLEAQSNISNIRVVMTIYDQFGSAITTMSNDLVGRTIACNQGGHTLVCRIPRNPFTEGKYRVAASMFSNGKKLDSLPSILLFSISGSIFFDGARVPDKKYSQVHVAHDWIINDR